MRDLWALGTEKGAVAMVKAPEHATRYTYQKGCRCLPCRASNANYQARLRQIHREERRPLGAYQTAQDAARLVRSLLLERYTKRALATKAGLERHTLKLKPSQRVRLSTVLRVRHAYRMLIGPDEATVS